MDKLWKGRSKDLASFKIQASLSVKERLFIFGTLLGDASLIPNASHTGFRLQVEHCIDQKSYVEWKYQLIKNFVLTPPRFHSNNQSWKFRTISHPFFSKMASEFYTHSRRKVLPKNTNHLLRSPFVFAVWYMDDGCLKRWKGQIQGGYINSQSFSKIENIALKKMLWKIHNLPCTLEKNKGKYRLFFPKRSLHQLQKLITPFILPCFRYKLPLL